MERQNRTARGRDWGITEYMPQRPLVGRKRRTLPRIGQISQPGLPPGGKGQTGSVTESGKTGPYCLRIFRAACGHGLIGSGSSTKNQSLSRPGGNVTGLSVAQGEFTAKPVEILKETVPHAV